MTDRELIIKMAGACEELSEECTKTHNQVQLQQKQINLLIDEVKRLGEGLTLAMEWIKQHS